MQNSNSQSQNTYTYQAKENTTPATQNNSNNNNNSSQAPGNQPYYPRGSFMALPNRGWTLYPTGHPDRDMFTGDDNNNNKLHSIPWKKRQGDYNTAAERNTDHWDGDGGQWSKYQSPDLGNKGWGWGPRR
jgi:hypothetical protein